ncbi:MAG: ABC transporter permease [Granulosicoccus sp.]
MKSQTTSSASNEAASDAINRAAGPRWTYRHRGYALAQSFRQLTLRKWSSLSTLLMLGITLALPVLLLFAAGPLQQLGNRGVEGESLTLYLDAQITDLQGASLAQELLGQPGIRKTSYISHDEALATLTENSDVSDALEVLGSNPLPGAIVVYPDADTLEPVRLERLSKTLGKMASVERIQLDLQWVKRLHAVVELLRLLAWLLAGFLTLTALLVIGNTIRLELLRRQREREVASLLGASRHFLNRPILYTGALYGFLGGLMACLLAFLTFQALLQPAHELATLYASSFHLKMPTASQFGTVLAISTLLGLIGALGTLYRPSR